MLSDYKVASVDFATKVLGFQQDDRSVHALAFGKNGEERITGSFLIGADGADSRVRQSAGILYEGLTYPELFLVIGTTFPFEEHIPNLSPVNYVSDPDEWCVLLKTDESWRVLVPTEVGADREKLLSDSFIGSRLKRIVPEAEGSQVLHRSLYHVHQRVAETYRIGRRVVLAGDAAHINNPLGGMGMNGGIHDAINLGEKLVEIIRRGGAPDKLLDLYERQRRGICIRFVQEHTKANKALMEASEREQQRERQENLMRAAKSPAEAKAFLMRNSMIDCVRDSYRIK